MALSDDIAALPDTPVAGQVGINGNIGTLNRAAKAHEAELLEKVDTIRLGDTFMPIQGVFPAAKLVSDTLHPDNPPSGYDSMTGTRWDSNKFNTQGQLLEAVVPSNPNAGAVNKPTSRNIGSLVDIEFLFDGDKFTIHFQAFGYFDIQIYIEDEGVMKKLHTDPWDGTYAGFGFRHIVLAERMHGRIRIVMPWIYFTQILHETNAVVRRAPDRPLLISDGDSYWDMSGGFVVGSSKTFATYGPNEAFLERTGWAVGRHGQGGTGYFNRGDGTSAEGAIDGGSTRFFSPDRLAGIKRHGVGKITAYLINGTINDGELSGGKAGMRARALAGYRALHAWDPGILIIVVGPEPFNDPPANGVHDLNRQGQMEAVAQHQAEGGLIVFFDPSKPGEGWWHGVGTEVTPNIYDAQSKLIGADGIHGNWHMYDLYGHWVKTLLESVRIPAIRRTPNA